MKLRFVVVRRLVFIVHISVVARIIDVATNGTKLNRVLMMKMRAAVKLNKIVMLNDIHDDDFYYVGLG